MTRCHTLQDYLSITPLVFVYGTLKYGHGNWSWILRDEEYVGPRVTHDKFFLGNVGFPYAFPEDVVCGLIQEEALLPVLGDLFKLSSEDTLEELDWLEGEGSHYHRVLTHTTLGEECWMYQRKDTYGVKRMAPCHITDEGEYQWKR